MLSRKRISFLTSYLAQLFARVEVLGIQAVGCKLSNHLSVDGDGHVELRVFEPGRLPFQSAVSDMPRSLHRAMDERDLRARLL